jgi:fluoride exporter
MQSTLFVMAGGAIGAALRYHAGLVLSAGASERWPLATIAVNCAGALAMGLLAGWALSRGFAEGWRLFLGVGLLGGFTTFSAFSLVLWQMLDRGAYWPAIIYAALSVTGTVALVAIGIALSRGITA